MRRFELERRDFGSKRATHWPCAWDWKGHVPEVCTRLGEFHSDIALAVARTPDGYNLTFDFFFSSFVFEFENLAEHHALLQFDGCTVQTNGV